jgi:hypothetical protein
MFSMAWSPVRRTNAGRFEVDHPGDYATLNSYHPVDGTGSAILGVMFFVGFYLYLMHSDEDSNEGRDK